MTALEGYLDLVGRYLADPGETALQGAYELGRQALAQGSGILDMLSLHVRALAQRLDDDELAADFLRRTRPLASELFAPFELAFRGYRQATDRLRASAAELEQRVAERTEALRAAEERFRSLVEQMPGVTYLSAPSGPRAPSYVSPQIERLVGLSAQAVARPDVWDGLVHPEDRERIRSAWADAERAAGPFSEQYRLVGEGGRVVWVEDQAALLRDDSGRPAHRLGILVDTSERRALEESLRQSQKMETIGQLAGGVAHDFNNLLSVILTFSTIHADALPADHPIREDLREIQLAGRRAAALTRQLLAFSRKERVAPRVVDVNALLGDMANLLRRLIGEHVALECALAPDAGCVRIDPGHLEQVVMNLAVNGRDAMPDGGKLEIRTARVRAGAGGDRVVLSVADTGCGMSEEVKAKAFDPFFTTKEPGKGTGLGLATCFGIVAQAGGRMEIETEVGRGTKVHVLLPRVEEAAEPARGQGPGPASGRGETVLLVEDDPSVRDATSRLLDRLGYRVLAAAEGAGALRILEARSDIRLMLTDVLMPGMTGAMLAERARLVRPGLKVLLASGHAESVIAPGGSGSPILAKPYTIDELARRLRALLDG